MASAARTTEAIRTISASTLVQQEVSAEVDKLITQLVGAQAVARRAAARQS